jgi:hypothetical protein
VQRGQISWADRVHLRAWLARFAACEDVAFAMEGCTGWRYVAEELAGAGITAHLAEPADTAFARGRKRHAKTDARHLRMLLAEGRLPECWIPPGHIVECRALLELYNDLRRERTAWGAADPHCLISSRRPGAPPPPTTASTPRSRTARTASAPACRRRKILRQAHHILAELGDDARAAAWHTRHGDQHVTAAAGPAKPLSAAAGPPGPGGRPDETERPHPRRRGNPINHHVTGAAQAPRAKVRLAAPGLAPGRHRSESPAQKGHHPRPSPHPPGIPTPAAGNDPLPGSRVKGAYGAVPRALRAP